MKEVLTDSAMLRDIQRGLSWAIAPLPGGRIDNGQMLFKGGAIRLFHNGEFKGTDGFLITPYLKDYLITASTPFGFVSGVTNAVWHIRHGVAPVGRRVPRFKSRFYKHETNLGQGPEARPVAHTHIAELDEAFWVDYCRALAERHFNGLVFFSTYHPFQYFLDYDEYPYAANGSKRQRAATLAGLKRAMGVARSFGMKTYLQHDLTFIPMSLALKLDIGLCNPRNREWQGGIDHPEVERYNRYAYRRAFELLPEMTGLHVNLYNTANDSSVVKRYLYSEAAKVRPFPEITFALGGFTSLPEMAELVRAYPGNVRLSHNIMDRADVYYYPVADRRVMEWKKAIPEAEFMFVVGPCYNCASAQSRTLWCDPEFVKTTLADARKKGADSVSFHTVYDLMCYDINASKLAGQQEIHMALLNRGHLEGFTEYIRGPEFVRERYESRLSKRLNLPRKQTSLVFGSTRESSRISLLIFQQFLMSSRAEGRLWDTRQCLYTDPFLFQTMAAINEQPKLAMDFHTSWLNTTNGKRYVPPDVQPIIDFVDPSKPRVKRNPLVMARLIKKHSDAALSMARRAAGENPSGIMATFMESTVRMRRWAQRVRYEIQAAVNIYRVFFSKSQQATLRWLSAALADLTKAACHSKADDPLSARTVPLLREWRPEEDIAALEELIRHLSEDDYPYTAFAAYARSLREYNEIRRTVRPSRDIRDIEVKTIVRQLNASIRAAEGSICALQGLSHGKYRANVARWLDFLEKEMAGLETPSYRVSRDGSAGDEFVQMLHDQCFRYGSNCIKDFDAFFTATDFLRQEPIFFRLRAVEEGLMVSVREEGVDVKARQARWEDWKGSISDTFCLHLYVEREPGSNKVEIFRISSLGRWCYHQAQTVHGRQHITNRISRAMEGGTARFRKGADWWRLDYTIPWEEFGGAPASGERWRANVTANPSVRANHQSTWCPGYDYFPGKLSRMGTLIFA